MAVISASTGDLLSESSRKNKRVALHGRRRPELRIARAFLLGNYLNAPDARAGDISGDARVFWVRLRESGHSRSQGKE
jgi:hypothetical protein